MARNEQQARLDDLRYPVYVALAVDETVLQVRGEVYYDILNLLLLIEIFFFGCGGCQNEAFRAMCTCIGLFCALIRR